MIRTFIAIDVTAHQSLLSVLEQLSRMGRSMRVVDAAHLHLTLRFLGDVEDTAIRRITDELRQCISGVPPFPLQLFGLGVFPHAQRPTVVWAGCSASAELDELEQRIADLATALGFSPDRLPFRPHVTLARVSARPPSTLANLLRQHAGTDFGVTKVQEVKLYRSDLTPQGPIYSVLARPPLS
jgi:2'-5' RNA ligase